MMALGWHFLLGTILSFVGSIPFGTINVTAAETAIRKGFQAALWFSFGAALVEFIQAFLCLQFSGFLTANPGITRFFQWASIPVFFTIGLYFYLTRKNVGSNIARGRNYHTMGFFKGVLISALNLLAIPYWVFLSGYLGSNGWLELGASKAILIFSAGVFFGTLLLLSLYARIAMSAGKLVKSRPGIPGLIVSMIFIFLALFQLGRMVLGPE